MSFCGKFQQLTLETQTRAGGDLLEELEKVGLEDLGASIVGTQDVQKPPSFGAAVPRSKAPM